MSGILDLQRIMALRRRDPAAIDRAWSSRRRRTLPGTGRLLIVAADHTARGAFGVREDRSAMASRPEILRRLAIALSRPGVDGVLGTADVLEDLLLAGLLEDKLVIGSMNRGGLHGATFELDDRFTGYRVNDLIESGLDGGKMLTRICLEDPGTLRTLESSAGAITALSRAGLMAMVEPFWSVRASGQVRNVLQADAVIRSIQVVAGLGASSAHTWLKLPVVPEMFRVLEATTLPVLMLGGDPAGAPADTYAAWRAALGCANAAGLVAGRALLYPVDGDVAAAIDLAVELVHAGEEAADG